MISVEKAIKVVENHTSPTQSSVLIELSESVGHVLYNDIIAPINMPPFRQSAMDGYALNIHEASTYNIVGEVKAGDNHHPKLNSGEAVRIFTGAPVPDSANAVIMQERVRVNSTLLTLESTASFQENIRPLGEQVSKGQIALKKGTHLSPAGVAFLRSLGLTEIRVYKKPSIAIVVTGNELAEAGQPLSHGQIYESNASMLQAALKNLGYLNIRVYKVADNYTETLNVLDQVINANDVVLVSGGISVGDYDFVGSTLQELNVEQLFYKVKQKPGKPLFFGKKEEKIIFALPGNPAAALSCFYIYVQAALERISGNLNFSFTKLKAQSVSSYIKKGDRGQFLKALYSNGKVEILDGQNSSMLHTFALANAMVYLSETADSIKTNDSVEVYLLPIN